MSASREASGAARERRRYETRASAQMPRFSPSPPRQERGFSLIEVLCAVLVLGVALAGLAEGITVSLRMGKEAERHTMAVLLATGRLETLRAEGDFTAGEESGDFGEDFGLYGWRQAITETGLTGLHHVRVEVVLSSTEELLYTLETQLFEVPILGLDGQSTETSTERRRRRAGEEQSRRRSGG